MYRQIKVESDSFCVSLKLGEIYTASGSSKDDVAFFALRDTLVLRRLLDIDRAIVTDSFTVSTSSTLEFYAELEVDGSDWIQRNWASSSEVTLTLTAVDIESGEPIGDIVSYAITRARIPSIQGYLTASLGRFAGRTIRIEVNGFASEDLGVQPLAVDERVPTTEIFAKTVASASLGIPSSISLNQNYPNPFNPRTAIEYALPTESHVQMRVFDVLGREIATLVDEIKKPGYHEASFDASNLASGIYIYRMNAGEFSSVKKMMVVK